MSDILCVTNRRLCKEDFLTRIEKIAAAHPAGIILREKDLPPDDYKRLAKETLAVCEKYNVLCILHSFTEAAEKLHAEAIHLPLPILQDMAAEKKTHFHIIGASCHSLEDVKKAQKLGCTYVTAGHIFSTNCKKGLPGRGLAFLKNICKNSSVPVYAIGGICSKNIPAVRAAGAAGVCVMSGLMECPDAAAYIKNLEKAGKR